MTHKYLSGWRPGLLARPLASPRLGRALAALLVGLSSISAPALGQGTFGTPAYYNSSGASPIGIVGGDLNGDGRADLVVNNFGSSGPNLGVLLNAAAPAAAGTFPASATAYNTGGGQTAGSAIGDVNGDGRLDIVAGNIANNTVGVFLNAGNGTFPATATTYLSGGSQPVSLSLGDVNGDGRLDIVAAHQGGNTVGVLLNSATTPGTFGAGVQYTAGNSVYNARLGDVNGDGRLDIVTSNYSSNTVSVLLNSATTPGTFGAATSYSSGGSSPLGMDLGDINGDGRLDIVVNNLGSTLVGVLLNSATTPGTFGAVTTYNNGGSGEGLAVGDVSGDGKPDLIVSRSGGGTVGVLVNSGTGTFPTLANYTVGGNLNARVALVDVNNDGLLDLALTDFNNSRVAVLRNTSTIPAPVLSSVNPTSGPVGTSVTITGTNLLTATGVSFNGTAATGFTIVNATTITATVPAGATTGNVTVTTGGGTSNGVAFTVIQPTVQSVTGLTPSPTATGTVSYRVVFSTSVSGLSASNFSFTTTGTVSGAGVASITGSGTTYTVGVNTGTGDGTLRLNVNNSTGLTPALTNLPYTSGTTYTITKSFAAAPTLRIQAAGSTSGNSDVTAFVDVVQVLNASNGSAVANGLQNNSFETNNVNPGSYLYQSQGVVAAPWTFGPQAGVTRNNSAFGSTAASGDAVAFLQSAAGLNGSVSQNLAVPTGSYQINFRTIQRNYTSLDQQLNVFVNDVFVGNIQPNNIPTYETFTSASFSVAAPALTATITSTAGTNGGSTGTSPIPFTVTFSQSVTGFTASDVTVSNGTLSGFTAASGTTYTFNVTPSTNGTVTVNVPANSAVDANNTGNTAAPQFSIQYNAPITATTWTGAISNDWFAVGNWTAGVPTATVDATIPGARPNNPLINSGAAAVRNLTLASGATLSQTGGTLTVDANLTNNGSFVPTGGTVVLGATAQSNGPNILGSGTVRFWDLTVQNNGVLLSTSAGATVRHLLTLNGAFVTQGNSLTLESNNTATAMVVNNAGGFVFGAATVQRYLDPSLNSGLGYRHYSSPVQGATVGSMATADFLPVVNPDYNTVGNTVTPFPTVYGYDEARIVGTNATTQDFEYGYFSPNTLGDQLTLGRGYTVNLNASAKVALTGALNNGTIGVGALSRGAEANSGWHLLGNPYPAPLDWNVARTSLPAGVIDAIYVYKSSSQYDGTYQFYQNGFGTLPGGLIGSMQGFFVRVSQPVASFSFQNAWRATSYQNPTFNRPAAETRPAVQLDLVSAQGTHEPAFVYFEDGATAGLDDHFDAEKIPNTTGLNLASLAAGKGLAVNGLPLLTASTDVPLSVGVPTTGAYTLEAASLVNLSTADVYLHDAVTGQQINLKQQSSYRFTASNSALITNRFTLRFAPLRPLAAQAGLTAASVSVYPNPTHQQFTLAVPAVGGATQAQAVLYNVLGQPVRETSLPLPAAGAQATISVQGLPVGVYVLRVKAGATTVTKQVVVD